MEKTRKINTKVNDEGLSRLTQEYLEKIKIKEPVVSEEPEYPTRRFIQAEDGVCTSAFHNIIVLGSIPWTKEVGSVDEFYCPTCNKFWREH